MNPKNTIMPDTNSEADTVSMTTEGDGGEEDIPDLVPIEEQSRDEYFASYEDVEIHRLMVNDVPRTTAYRDAIYKNKHLFKDKIVMDVGAGTGILSLFMASAGAKKVYAVEASGMAQVIQQVARDNGFSDIIQVFHKRVEDIILPEEEKVDVIVSEWMGFYLLHESMLNSIIIARDTFLSDEGTVFPSEARIYAAPCSLKSLYSEQINFWDNVYGFNMNSVKQYALRSKMIKPEVCLVPEDDLLANPTCIKTFNLRWITEEELRLFTETTFIAIARAGNYQGLCLWFECDFDGRDYDEEGKEFGTVVTLSTAPSSPSTHWKQTVVVLGYISEPESAPSHNNDSQEIELTCNEGHPAPHSQDEGHSEACGNTSNINNGSDEGKQKSNEQNQTVETSNVEYGIYKDYKVDVDEVVGWKIALCQSDDNVRHYTMTVEMLDPEVEEHPMPCQCPMPRCLIISKMIEKEDMEADDDIIDCT
ncbi:unnamed protein product [Meganyctiphanes norvegica]|uniref:type I protein arginine methyltransferase n=1 Tax=Meganyctiphanes norvegica TaxID=48144 RepID=A0AAV2SD01_MEGNR